MLPYFYYKKNQFLNLKYNKKKYIIFKNFLIYIIYYIYPRRLVFFIEPILKTFRINKFKFIRSDCDHLEVGFFIIMYT